MSTNKQKLRGAMLLHGDTMNDLAEALGIAYQTLSMKMNANGSEFTQGEIAVIRERYKLSDEQVIQIFFEELVS